MVTHYCGVTPCINRFSTLFTWNSNFRHLVNQGHAQNALILFRQMKQSGITPNNSTFPFVLKACAKHSHRRNSQIIYARVLKSCFQSNIFVQTAMVDMYAKCGHLDDAHNVFVEMPVRDIASWNAMLLGFAQSGFLDRLPCLLRHMRLSGIRPDTVTVLLLIDAVLCVKSLTFLGAVHSFGIRIGVHMDVSVAYSKLMK